MLKMYNFELFYILLQIFVNRAEKLSYFVVSGGKSVANRMLEGMLGRRIHLFVSSAQKK